MILSGGAGQTPQGTHHRTGSRFRDGSNPRLPGESQRDVRPSVSGNTLEGWKREATRIPDRWNHFLSPPQLVAREDVQFGYHPIYEYAALPDIERLTAAIRTVME